MLLKIRVWEYDWSRAHTDKRAQGYSCFLQFVHSCASENKELGPYSQESVKNVEWIDLTESVKQILAELLMTQNQSWLCGFTHIRSVLLLLELSLRAELPPKEHIWEQEPVCRVSLMSL